MLRFCLNSVSVIDSLLILQWPEWTFVFLTETELVWRANLLYHAVDTLKTHVSTFMTHTFSLYGFRFISAFPKMRILDTAKWADLDFSPWDFVLISILPGIDFKVTNQHIEVKIKFVKNPRTSFFWKICHRASHSLKKWPKRDLPYIPAYKPRFFGQLFN